MVNIGTDSYGNQGASYIGAGGYCDNGETGDLAYGNFNTGPNPDDVRDTKNDILLGSAGVRDNKLSAGGGRIHIEVDSLELTSSSHIRANGYPLAEDVYGEEALHGGSGGHIYILTKNTDTLNTLHTSSRISAVGGNGNKLGFGGSGGVLNLVKDMQNGYIFFAHGGKGGSEVAKGEEAIKHC